jgi:hypothetical protein
MYDHSSLEPEDIGHEPTTVGARAIVFGLSCVLGALVVALVLMAGLKAYFAVARVEEPTIGSAGDPIAPPPGVTPLDADQPSDLRRLRRRERELLTDYAWIDRDAGVARIPIGRAMEILSQSPLTEQPVDNVDDQ